MVLFILYLYSRRNKYYDFWAKIKNGKKKQEIYPKELARAIGTKHNSIHNWENDKNKPTSNTIELICNVLDVSANYLLVTNDPKTQLSPEAIEIGREYAKAKLTKQNIIRLALGFELESKVTKLE